MCRCPRWIPPPTSYTTTGRRKSYTGSTGAGTRSGALLHERRAAIATVWRWLGAGRCVTQHARRRGPSLRNTVMQHLACSVRGATHHVFDNALSAHQQAPLHTRCGVRRDRVICDLLLAAAHTQLSSAPAPQQPLQDNASQRELRDHMAHPRTSSGAWC